MLPKDKQTASAPDALSPDTSVLFKNCRYLIRSTSPRLEIIEDGALYVSGSEIAAVGPTSKLSAEIADLEAAKVIDGSDKIVMPGLVDAHNHVGEIPALLVFGWLEDPITSTMDALERVYWPADSWFTPESAYDLTLFGLMHMLKHGTTTHANAFPFPKAVYRATSAAGARGVIHPQMVTAVRLPDAEGEEDYLEQTERAIQEFHGASEGLIRVGVHPNCAFNCTASLLERGMALAEEYDVQFAIHIAETPQEKEAADQAWPAHGGLLGFLNSLGLVNERTLFFHGTVLDEAEIDILAEANAALVHCPPTNAIFGYCAYLPYMLSKDLRVGIGTDFPTHNLFNVMLSAAQHHNIMPREMRGLDAHIPLDLATMGGARALGLDHLIGSLEPGKKADVITIDLSLNTDLFPLNRQVLPSMLALNGAGVEAHDVMVNGVFLRRNGEFLHFDEAEIFAKGQAWCEEFARSYLEHRAEGRSIFTRIHDDFATG